MKQVLSLSKLATLATLIASALPTFAAETQEPAEVKARIAEDRSIFKRGAPIKFQIQAVFNDPEAKAKTLECELFVDGKSIERRSVAPAESCAFSIALDKPGWTAAMGTLIGEDGKPLKRKNPPNQWDATVKGGIGALVEPEGLKEAAAEPVDFDEFWKEQRAALDKVPMNPKLVEVEFQSKNKGLVRCYDVTLDCLGGAPVRGYLSIPVDAKAKSLPAIVHFDGAGVRSATKPVWFKDAIVFQPNPHGIENGKPDAFYAALEKGALSGYSRKGEENRDAYYFKGMLLRAMRSMDFVKSLPEWDGRNLISDGSSMGGFQAIAAAALEPSVSCCNAVVPALGDLSAESVGHEASYPKPLRSENGKLKNPDALKTIGYFDSVNFAKRLRCETHLSTGLIDFTCPPTAVHLIFNAIPENTPKDIRDYPDDGHSYKCATNGKRVY